MIYVFAALLAVQLGYWLALLWGFRRVQRAQPEPTTARPPAVSALVAAHNEATALPDLLPALCAQRHPEWEALIADDGSTDGTPEVVRQAAQAYPQLRLVPADPNTPPRKKQALTRAIAVAQHPFLAFTDADCTPPPTWLSALARHHAADPEALLVGYSPMRPRQGVLNAFVRYETLVTAFLTAAAIGLNRPYMAVGRNLAYPATLFERIGGFAHSESSLSGDDDLLVQHVARTGAAPVRYMLDPASFVPTEAPVTWAQWGRQKRRHTSASRWYTRSSKLHLSAFHLSGTLLWLAPLFVWPGGLGVLALKLLIQYRALSDAATALEETSLLPAQPLLEIGYVLYNAVVAPIGVLFGTRRW